MLPHLISIIKMFSQFLVSLTKTAPPSSRFVHVDKYFFHQLAAAGLYMGAILFLERFPLTFHRTRLFGTFIVLLILSVYPLLALENSWIIPFPMTYTTIYPILPFLVGGFLIVSFVYHSHFKG